ncbi:MAG: hypothetical protein LBR22_02245 [Desulfovibrio sp.]|nr:hypothetical protein [Desulfovibrio sp.]
MEKIHGERHTPEYTSRVLEDLHANKDLQKVSYLTLPDREIDPEISEERLARVPKMLESFKRMNIWGTNK